jgi:hypothetical protein
LDLQLPWALLGLLSQSGQLRLPDLLLLLDLLDLLGLLYQSDLLPLPDLLLLLDLQLPLDLLGLLNQSDLLHLLSP